MINTFNKLKEKLKTFTESIKKQIDSKANEKVVKYNDIIEENNKENISFLKRAKLFLFDGEIVITLKDIEKHLEILELELLESDVALNVCEIIIENIKNELIGTHQNKEIKIDLLIEHAIRNAIKSIISKNYFDFDNYIKLKKGKLIHILLIGVNGTGKTTSLAKLANYLNKYLKCSVVMAAGDTYRAGAIDQLNIHSNKLKIKIIKYENREDPTSIIYDAVKYCQSNKIDVLLSDTAGRMHTNKNLMAQLKKIHKITKPDLTLFVEDATSGNDIIERFTYFNNIVPIDGTILTKLDADSKGGSVVSIAYISKKPIFFVGIGQKYEDFKKFDPDWFVSELFTKKDLS